MCSESQSRSTADSCAATVLLPPLVFALQTVQIVHELHMAFHMLRQAGVARPRHFMLFAPDMLHGVANQLVQQAPYHLMTATFAGGAVQFIDLPHQGLMVPIDGAVVDDHVIGPFKIRHCEISWKSLTERVLHAAPGPHRSDKASGPDCPASLNTLTACTSPLAWCSSDCAAAAASSTSAAFDCVTWSICPTA